MNGFQAWREWAAGLDDAGFSRLWLALGAAMALRPDHFAMDTLAEVWGAALLHQELRWTMPGLPELAATRLQGSSAQDWMQRWDTEIGTRLDKVPVRIDGWPSGESSEAWFLALTRIAAVATLRLSGSARRMLDWPLRLAALDESERPLLARCMELWPANQLARRVGGQGDGYTCDVLLCSDEPRELIDRLRSRSISTAIVVVLLQRACDPEDRDHLHRLCEAAYCSGYVLVEDVAGIDMPGRIRRFVEEMSHARRVDVAFSLAFRGAPQPALIALGDELARFDIREIAERLQARTFNLERAQGLPVEARKVLDAAMPRLPSMADPANPEDSALESLGAESSASPGGLESLGSEAEVPPASAPVSAPASAQPAPVIPDYDLLEAPYDHEWGGAKGLVEAAEVLDRAEALISSQRFLQQRSFLLYGGQEQPAIRGFEVGRIARVRVHIGPPDGESDALPEAFPENALPQERESWDLQVWLAEPTHVPIPLLGNIHLRRRGASTSCEFEFTPESTTPFHGRISVLYRGRVIQSAALRASVHVSASIPEGARAPKLESIIQVKRNLSGLDRRRFDLALVLNHAGTDQPTVHAMGEKRAWLSNLSVVEKTVADINALLSSAARTAKDFIGGLESKKGGNLLRKLAQLGNYLHLYLIESHHASAGTENTALGSEYIQIVSTRSDAIVIPFEFIYEFDAPNDAAQLCPNWREGIANGHCAATCVHDEDSYCPMGFWGLSKVIERHAIQADLASAGEVGVQSEPAAGRETLKLSGSAVFGCSERVVDAQLEPLRQQLLAAQLTAKQATDWKDWKIRVGQSHPSLLIALAHSDGSGQDATVEIGGKPIKIIGITKSHIRADGESGQEPLVALLGCDMAGTGDAYANPVAVFRVRGAAVVVGTIATVLAEHSAEVAARLMRGLTSADPSQTRRLGEAIRDLKRNALLDGELMPLCLVSFGDADWLLTH